MGMQNKKGEALMAIQTEKPTKIQLLTYYNYE